jgi:GNAT superfamily N-acetyltransferase
MTTTLTDLHLPPAFAGYRVQPYTLDDDFLTQSARLLDENDARNGFETHHTPEDIREDLISDPDLNLDTCSRAVYTPEGRLVAKVAVWDTAAVPVRVFMDLDVTGDHMEQGLEDALITWGEARARQAIDRCPPSARVYLECWSYKSETARQAHFARHGFEVARYFYNMKITMDAPPVMPTLPEGFSFRTFNYPEELPDYVDVRVDSFRDHWGFVEQPREKMIENTRNWYDNDSLFDASLCYFVIDDSNGRIAAFSMNRIEEWGKPEQSYVMTLGTRRDYRGKGLALAVLQRSFLACWERGKRAMSLHVDASSLTNAVRLYEKAGMSVNYVELAMRKVLRDGVDFTRSETSGG